MRARGMMAMCPFADPALKPALAGALLVSLSGAPLGVMLVLRRMSLMGDVIAHAILPGTAAGFIMAGMSFPAMSLGGLIAGLIVAFVASLATRFTSMREDASLATFYLLAVAVGILMLALHGSAQDLEDILFGNAAAIDSQMLIVMAVITSVTLLTLAVIYRPLVVESFDPAFMRAVRGRGGLYHVLFMLLVVLNMVEGYRTLGTLMASGLLLIPGVASQFWTQRLEGRILLAVAIAAVSSVIGIWLAYAFRVPSGPAIVLVIGGIYVVSFMLGRYGSIRARYFPLRHLER
jgi:zinc/manganese transport system permease protein